MRQLIKISESGGHTVTGSDIVLGGHNPENAEAAEFLVYTMAVSGDNCELIRARERGIPVMERAEFLGRLSLNYQNIIAVSGSHGKTTATAMIAEIFRGKNPTVHIGGDYAGFKNPAGGAEFFITEACEYKKSFLHLRPSLAVVLNAELDHTDYYRGEADYFSAFRDFTALSKSATVFGDDQRLFDLAVQNGYTTFGFLPRNAYTARNIVRTKTGRVFDIYEKGAFLFGAELNLYGLHNVLNALAAVSAARAYGLEPDEIARAIARIDSVGRRFELLGTVNGARVYSDYAHHPGELNAMISAARETGGDKLTVVFEPHTYSRTLSLYREFALALSAADEAIVTPVYASREAPQPGVSSRLIFDELNRAGKAEASYCARYEEVFDKLKKTAGKNRIIVFAGAGTIDEMAREFVTMSG